MPGYSLKTPRPPVSYGDRPEIHRRQIRDALAEVLDLIENGSIGNLIYCNSVSLTPFSSGTTISAPGVTTSSGIFVTGLTTSTSGGHGPMLASNSQWTTSVAAPVITVGTVIPFNLLLNQTLYGSSPAWTIDGATNQFVANVAGTTHFRGQVGGEVSVAGPVDLQWDKVSGATAPPFSPLGLFGGRGTLDPNLAVAPVASGVSTHYPGDRYRLMGVASVFAGGPGTYDSDDETVVATLDTTPLGLDASVSGRAAHGLTAEAGTDQIFIYHAVTNSLTRLAFVAAFDNKV